MKKSLALVLSIMLFVVLGCSMLDQKDDGDKVDTTTTEKTEDGDTKSTDSSDSDEKETSSSDSDSGAVSIANYEKIKLDMSYDDVKGIMGSDGEETSSSSAGKYEYKRYKWQNDNKTINVSFRNDKAQTVSYSGYPSAGAPRDADLSMDKYNQIKNGQEYDKVKEIIGSDGMLISSSRTSTSELKTYTWRGDKYSTITVSFRNGEVSSKRQSQVK